MAVQPEGPWTRRTQALFTGDFEDLIRPVNGYPKARYVFSKVEQAYWEGAAGKEGFNAGVYEDSVLPVIEAGQADVIEGRGEIGEGLWIEPTPGHSAGHVAIRLLSRGEEGLFSGDVMHQPVQVYRPAWNTRFCTSPEEARQSRRWVLEHCAESGALLFPAHFAGSSVGRVERKGEGFAWQFA